MGDEETYHFRCSVCDVVLIGSREFKQHLKNLNHGLPLSCGQNECRRSFQYQSSLLRHIREDHINRGADGDVAAGNPPDVPHTPGQDVVPLPVVGALQDEDDGRHQDLPGDANECLCGNRLIDLKRAAANVVLNLRQTSALTCSIIERFQDACMNMIDSVSELCKQKVQDFLVNEGIDNTDAARTLLRDLSIENPFSSIRTLKQQLRYFASEMGLVVLVPHFLGYRVDFRLNTTSNQYEPAQVGMTYEYIPLIETLKLILSNPKYRHLIDTEKASDDGVLRSYLDGTRAKASHLIRQYPRIIRIQIYVDDLELANALGSRTVIHKITAFYFSIQNLPPVEASKLASIFLLALAYTEDLKGEDAYNRVLYPFLQDLKKLESPEGVMIVTGDEAFCLRATLVVLCADTLAAHDILGFLSPAARHSCRRCLISRQVFLRNCSAVGQRRSKASFEEDVQRVKETPGASIECGIKRDCPLHESSNFSATDDAPFDAFHDLLEGVCHVIVLLALRSFVCTRRYFSVHEFNARLVSFSYGIPDSRNKPSANFTLARLQGKHMLQKGLQTWCLIRVFTFLVPEVPENDSYLKLFNLLQECMLITFSPEIRPEDITKLEQLIQEFLELFQELHMDPLEVLDDPDEDGIPGNAGPEARESPINKMHHMVHYPDIIRELGPAVRYWCIRYEARHHIFVKYAAVCCNFINVPKSMAQMHQISTLASVLKTSFRKDDVEVLSGESIMVSHCDNAALLATVGLDPDNVVADVRAALVSGEDFRPGLFVVIDASGPSFGLIRNVYCHQEKVYFVVLPWKTELFARRYCAFHVQPDPDSALIALSYENLGHHLAIAPWNPVGLDTVFLAPRTILF